MDITSGHEKAASGVGRGLLPPVANRRQTAQLIGFYFLPPLLSIVGVSLVLQLWRADLCVPLCDRGDAICSEVWVKTVLEDGWYLRNPRLGAPWQMEMHD